MDSRSSVPDNHAAARSAGTPRAAASEHPDAADLLRFQRALLGGQLFEQNATIAFLTERSNLLRNAFPLRYGLGTMIFRVGRLNAPDHRPITLVGHSGATGTWLFHCPELDVHLTGTIDQARDNAPLSRS